MKPTQFTQYHDALRIDTGDDHLAQYIEHHLRRRGDYVERTGQKVIVKASQVRRETIQNLERIWLAKCAG